MRAWERAACILFLVQLAALCFFNLSDLRFALDADFAATAYHGREMVRNKTLFLPGWHYTTTMEFDGALLFAVPLFALTGNLFLSFGIADCLFVALFLITLWALSDLFDLRYGIRFIVCTAVITPYAYGWLDYFKMLFHAHANYAVKALVPLLLVLYLLRGKRGFRGKKETLCLAGYLILYFISCVSSGTYVMVCGVFPVLLVRLIDIWIGMKDGAESAVDVIKAVIPVYALTVIAGVAGVLLHKRVYPFSVAPWLTKKSVFTDNMLAVFRGYYAAYGALTEEDVMSFSAAGVYYCLKCLLVTLLLVFACRVTVRWLKGDVRYRDRVLLCAVFWFNTAILILGDMRYGAADVQARYQLIGLVPLPLVAGIELQDILKTRSALQETLLMACVTGAAALIACGNTVNVHRNTGYAGYAVEIVEYFGTLDAEAVIFADDRDTAYFCRAIDETKKYGCYQSATRGMERLINSYEWETDPAAYGDKIAYAIPDFSTPEAYFPPEITQGLRYAGATRWFAVYLSG